MTASELLDRLSKYQAALAYGAATELTVDADLVAAANLCL